MKLPILILGLAATTAEAAWEEGADQRGSEATGGSEENWTVLPWCMDLFVVGAGVVQW